MTASLRKLDKLVAKGTATHQLDKDQQSVRISEISWLPDERSPLFACVLLTYGDVRGADPCFGNVETGAIRAARKKVNEANAVSAHLLIKLKYKNHSGKRWYDAILEDVPGIGKTKIQPVMTALLRECEGHKYQNAEGQQAIARPRFVLEPKDADDLVHDVSRGTLKYFIAVKELPHTVLDEEGYVEQVQESQKLRPSDVFGGAVPTFLQQLTAVTRWAKRNSYDRVKVVYDRRDGKNRTITLDSPREDAEDFLIKKIEKITLTTAIDQACESVRAELVAEMEALLVPKS